MGLFVRERRPTAVGWMGLLAGAALLGLVFAVGDSGSDRCVEAHGICQEFVKDRLKSPSSARFPAWKASNKGAARVSKRGDGSYQVRGYVDAKNELGVELRSKYFCRIRPTGDDKWQLVELRME